MSDTDLSARDEEVIETYTRLFMALGSLIERDAFIGIMELIRKGVFMAATVDMWDELMKLAERQQSPGLSYIKAAHAGKRFAYEAYAESVHALDAVKLGGFLWSWEHAREAFGGQLVLNQLFRALRGAELDRMVEYIYRSIEKAA